MKRVLFAAAIFVGVRGIFWVGGVDLMERGEDAFLALWCAFTAAGTAFVLTSLWEIGR